MKFKLLFIILLCLPLVVGAVFQQSSNIEVKHPVRINEFPDNSITCNITLYNPYNIVLVDYQEMTNNYDYHNYTLLGDNTSFLGIYNYDITCTTGSANKTESFSFNVTPSGEESSTAKGIFYLVAILLLIVFLVLVSFGFSRSESPTTKLLSFYGIYILLTAISYISWITSINFLTVSQFIGRFFWIIFLIFMIGLFPVILVSFIYYIWLILNIKQIQRMVDKGIPYDEAYSRKVGRFKLR